jgi:carbon-monoxide dehydrogenase catalytic subunit
MADPIAASIDPATQEMIARAQKLDIETVFDRAVTKTLQHWHAGHLL